MENEKRWKIEPHNYLNAQYLKYWFYFSILTKDVGFNFDPDELWIS